MPSYINPARRVSIIRTARFAGAEPDDEMAGFVAAISELVKTVFEEA